MRQQVTPPPDGDYHDSSDSDNEYQNDDDFKGKTNNILESDKVRTTFEDIISQARTGNLDVRQKPDRVAFINRYEAILEKTTRDSNQTILHMCAGIDGLRSLPRCLLRWRGSLLGAMDDAGKTPLHIAISKNNTDFIDVVFKVIKDLDPLLAMRYEYNRNCIHAAICQNLNAEHTIKLIEKASEETLSATDQGGLTPIHMAVDYKDASESRLRVVQALLQHGNSALDVLTKEPQDLSVYQYHQFTKKSWHETVSSRIKVGGRTQDESGLEVQDHKVHRVGHVAFEYTNPQQQEKDGHKGEAVDLYLKSLGNHQGHIPAVESSQGHDEFKLQRRQTGGHSGQSGGNVVRKSQKEETQRSEYANKILQEVKLHYLRTTLKTDRELASRDQHKAVRFLHGSNFDNVNLCFDYSQGPSNIFEDSFTQSYDHINFDPFLRYVSFRRIELQRPAPPTKSSRLANMRSQRPKTGRGRTDLTVLFGWLERKRVERILKVVVDDLKDPPHSDKAIEDCLTKFDVEVLDWRKVDLCPETIFTACPNVRQLYLRWSGNRAVLRAWGEPEGLPRLAKLEEVHLVWDDEQTLESDDRINTYVEDFKERLNEAAAPSKNDKSEAGEEKPQEMRNILVFKRKADTPGSERLVQQGVFANSQSGTNEMNQQSNRWLNCMDSFADEIQNMRSELVKPLHDIKVALIDDGADPYVESLRGKIRGGESFDSAHENGPSPYYTSSKGHGTVMADMICRVCPMAKLYVYKLETHASLNLTTQARGREYIAAESAALAVRAAINQKVDIISMSWTVKDTDDNHKAINSLRDAVKDALNEGILLFCAAADTGAVTEIEYPWSYDRERIFRIGAATADGRVWSLTGDPRNLTFIVPGHKVVSRNPHREGALPDDFEERTGSSVATALAAGLAAVILYCVRLGAVYAEKEAQQGVRSTTAVSNVDLERLKRHPNMHSVLRSIGLDEGQQRFIEVWRRFECPAQELKKAGVNTSDKALDVVARLARDLVSGMPVGSN
ncbi:hypothetical protein F53441_1806 [Fusarium austroafricanum]|uniref:Peptidase S8/S53 domain-containing protein n=1 Tax=Fusarium austroafricanum TaxID=2364996 RepID=A0A8H4NYH9_9HYPO|nr:hypothetical protein F53441_1806 [Fusarium austroafricanum]